MPGMLRSRLSPAANQLASELIIRRLGSSVQGETLEEAA